MEKYGGDWVNGKMHPPSLPPPSRRRRVWGYGMVCGVPRAVTCRCKIAGVYTVSHTIPSVSPWTYPIPYPVTYPGMSCHTRKTYHTPAEGIPYHTMVYPRTYRPGYIYHTAYISYDTHTRSIGGATQSFSLIRDPSWRSTRAIG